MMVLSWDLKMLFPDEAQIPVGWLKKLALLLLTRVWPYLCADTGGEMYVVVPHTASPSLALAASVAGVTWSKAERLSCAGLAL